MRYTLFIIPLAAPLLALSQEVVATGGGYHIGSGTAISYTIGEPVIVTAVNPSNSLTQGFQQPWADINTVVEESITDGPTITVYPNPVRHTLHIAMEGTPDRHRYELHDALGRQVTDGRIGSTLTDIDMQPYASGSYYLRVLGPNNISVRSFKISVTH